VYGYILIVTLIVISINQINYKKPACIAGFLLFFSERLSYRILAAAVILAIDAAFFHHDTGEGFTAFFLPVFSVEYDAIPLRGGFTHGKYHLRTLATSHGECGAEYRESTLSRFLCRMTEAHADAGIAALPLLGLTLQSLHPFIPGLREIVLIDHGDTPLLADTNDFFLPEEILFFGIDIRIIKQDREVIDRPELVDHCDATRRTASMEEKFFRHIDNNSNPSSILPFHKRGGGKYTTISKT
jgi:hypothetical protein